MNRLLNSPSGKIIISILWGMGLALLFFRQTCDGPDCIVLKAPPKSIKDETYLHDSQCFQFTPYSVTCNKKPIK
jgi:hypothetical protein